MNVFCRNLLACGLLLLVSSGCLHEEDKRHALSFEARPVTEAAQASGLPEEQEAALISRVEGKWRAMVQRDFATAYEYTTPNFRSIFSKSMYLNKFGSDVRWQLTGVDVLNYDAEVAVASVAVRVMSESTKQTTLASGGGPIANTINEKWFLIDGEWWNNAK